MILSPFEPEHLTQFEAQGPQKPYLQWMTPDIGRAAAAHFSFTGHDAQGRIVGCAGLAPIDGALVAWALFSVLLEANALAVTRAVRQGLNMHRATRVVAHIHPEHVKAARFAETLQFRFAETRADLHPSGAPLYVYVREGVNG